MNSSASSFRKDELSLDSSSGQGCEVDTKSVSALTSRCFMVKRSAGGPPPVGDGGEVACSPACCFLSVSCKAVPCRVILAYMCVKLQMRLYVCHRVGPFCVHFVSILGRFWVDFGSILLVV